MITNYLLTNVFAKPVYPCIKSITQIQVNANHKSPLIDKSIFNLPLILFKLLNKYRRKFMYIDFYHLAIVKCMPATLCVYKRSIAIYRDMFAITNQTPMADE